MASPTRTIAISRELADRLAVEAALKQQREGRPVTIREIAETGLEQYLEELEHTLRANNRAHPREQAR